MLQFQQGIKRRKYLHLAVDLGATSSDEAKRIAPLGTSITFATKFHDLGETIYGKAFDDRAGCAILLTLLQGMPFPFDVYGVFTVQEEIGLRGATVAAYAIEPDAALVLEGTLADEYPREENRRKHDHPFRGQVPRLRLRIAVILPHPDFSGILSKRQKPWRNLIN